MILTLALTLLEVDVARVLTYDAPPAPLAVVTPVADLEVGDCFTSADPLQGSDVDDARVVPCTEGHTYEVFALPLHDGDDAATYPSEVDLREAAVEACLDSFESYVGQEFVESDFDIVYLYPTSSSWGAGDREIVCVLTDLRDDDLNGSARDSGR